MKLKFSALDKLSLLLIVVTGILVQVGRHDPRIFEFHARGPYLWFAPKISFLSGLVPFSLTLISFVLILGTCLALPVLRALKYWKHQQGFFGGVIQLLVSAVLTVGNFLCLYFWLWGFHYLRQPIPMPLASSAMKQEEFQAVMTRFAERTNSLRLGLVETREGCIQGIDDLSDLDSHLEPLQNKVLQDFGLPTMHGSRTKAQLFSRQWLKIGSAGIFGPFTFERNVSWPAAPGTQATLVAHERTHFAGLSDETLANFIGILTVWSSERPLVQYSGWLTFWILAEPGPYPLAEGVLRDIRCHKNFWQIQMGAGSELAGETWNQMLQAQGVERGLASYRDVVRMLVDYKGTKP